MEGKQRMRIRRLPIGMRQSLSSFHSYTSGTFSYIYSENIAVCLEYVNCDRPEEMISILPGIFQAIRTRGMKFTLQK